MPPHTPRFVSENIGEPEVADNCEPIPTNGYVVPATPTVPVILLAYCEPFAPPAEGVRLAPITGHTEAGVPFMNVYHIPPYEFAGSISSALSNRHTPFGV